MTIVLIFFARVVGMRGRGDRSLGSIFFSWFWILFHDSTALAVIEWFPYLFVF